MNDCIEAKRTDDHLVWSKIECDGDLGIRMRFLLHFSLHFRMQDDGERDDGGEHACNTRI